MPALLVTALGLAGCNETGLQATVEKPAPRTQFAARPGVSPAGASIAFISLAGAPDSVRKQLGDKMTVALAKYRVRLASMDKADYLIRGHLTSFTTGRSTRVAFIWDVYGADKRRKRRLDDDIIVRRAVANPWSLVSDKIIATIAERSSRTIAAYLTYTPEAIAAAKGGRRSANRAKVSRLRVGQPDKPLIAASRFPALGFAPIQPIPHLQDRLPPELRR